MDSDFGKYNAMAGCLMRSIVDFGNEYKDQSTSMCEGVASNFDGGVGGEDDSESRGGGDRTNEWEIR